ncbi:MAG: C2H2-type zinc finger protein, partial [Proteobacteria bacterium]|nr:C2H2-type zinc finger protein [Pseudomonadota bacterium]
MQKELPEPYPPGADAEDQPTVAAGTSQASQESQKAPSEMLNMLSKMHYDLTKLAQNAGIPDLCSHEKKNRIENIISSVTSKDLVCKYCNKQFKALTNLKNHLRLKHLKKTAHYCDICKKYFAEATTLRKHMGK